MRVICIAAVLLLAASVGLAQEVVTPDLSDPASLARDWTVLAGQWRIEAGQIIQGDPAGPAQAFLKEPSFGDFTMELQFRCSSRGGAHAAQVLFRGMDTERYYLLHIDPRGRQVVVAHYPWAEPVRTPDVDTTLDEWHDLRLEMTGQVSTAFLDGQQVLQADTYAAPAGRIGLGTSEGEVAFRNIRISGQIVPSEGPFGEPKTRRSRVVVADAGMGGDEEFPDICLLKSNQMLCVFYAGYAHGSWPIPSHPTGAGIGMVRSTNFGKTWSKPQIILDTQYDDRDPSIMQLRDGTVLMSWFTHPGEYTGWHKDSAIIHIIRSDDNGRHWSQPMRVDTPFDWAAVSDPIHEQPDGTLLMAIYGGYAPIEEHPNMIPAVIRSRDGGRTWGETAMVENDYGFSLCEPAIIRLPSGRLLMMLRNATDKAKMCRCTSDDGGRTWTKAVPVGSGGDAPYLLRTSQGVLLCASRWKGTSLITSTDDGATWSAPTQIDVYGGGYPSMVELQDGKVYMVFYEGTMGNNIRAAVLEVSREGVNVSPQ